MYDRDDYFEPEDRQIDPELLDAIIADKRAKGQFRGGDIDYELAEGKQQLVNFRLLEGNNVIKVSGNGTIVITYRQGAL